MFKEFAALAAALVVALAGSVVGPNLLWLLHPSTMIRCRFLPDEGRDLEVTACSMVRRIRSALAERTKATMDGVVKGLHEDPHMLDVLIAAFCQHRQPTDPRRCGCRHLVGWGAWGAWRKAPQRRLHAGRSRPRFGHAPPFRSRRRPHTQTEMRFSNAEVYVAKAESDFGCRRKSPPRHRRMRNVLPERASYRSAVHQGRQVAHV